jgi:hypothetical protein
LTEAGAAAPLVEEESDASDKSAGAPVNCTPVGSLATRIGTAMVTVVTTNDDDGDDDECEYCIAMTLWLWYDWRKHTIVQPSRFGSGTTKQNVRITNDSGSVSRVGNWATLNRDRGPFVGF